VDAPGSFVRGNTCTANNPSGSASYGGIFVNNANNRIEDNHVTANGYAGIRVVSFVSYTNNVIIRNSVTGNGANNYVVPNAQIVGPLITTAGTITNSNPWANFSF
jgi:parallel beta-helix repeat protein